MSYSIKIQLTMSVTDEMVEAAQEAFPDLPEYEAVKKMANEEIAFGLLAEEDDGTTVDSVEVQQVA